MPTTIVTKFNASPGTPPAAGELAIGELAVNHADKKIYTKTAAEGVVELIGSTGGGGGDLPESQAINNTLRANGSGGWVEESEVKIKSNGLAVGVVSNNWAQVAISDGPNVPTSAVSSPYDQLALVSANNAGMAIISATTGTSAIAMGDTADIDAGGIRYNNNTDVLELVTFNDVALELTTTGATFHEYGGVGARVNLQGVGVAKSGEWYVNASNQMFLNNTQNTSFLMYCNGNPVQILEPNGTIRIPSLATGTVYSNNSTLTNSDPSDAALKTDVVDLTHGLDSVNALRPVSFKWLPEEMKDGVTHLGFIAQEAGGVIPEIFDDDKGLCGLRSHELIAVLVKAVQELSAQVEALKP